MEILQRFCIDKKVSYIVSDSAANMCKGFIVISYISISFTRLSSGMTTLNELREKAKDDEAYEKEVEEEMERYATEEIDEDAEVEAALREADLIEAAMEELDEFYRTSGYTRLSCVAHKVSNFFASNGPHKNK